MSTPIPIRKVDGALQHMRLNFKNQIFHSFVSSFARDEDDSGLSVKMVLDGGVERYKIGDRTHSITPGRFLVVNHHQRFECRVKSPTTVEGMCFYIDPLAVAQVQAFQDKGHAGMLGHDHNESAPEPLFLEKIYGLGESSLGHFLQTMAPILRDEASRARVDFDAFFMNMAERLVESQGLSQRLMDRLSNEKASTREELYRRVSLARQFIDDNYLREISLDQLAEVAMTSKYHFLRCFKEIYQCSPYQYVLQKRLQHGAQMLLSNRFSLSEVALETGFTDRRAFNKAFKKTFGQLPSNFREEQPALRRHI